MMMGPLLTAAVTLVVLGVQTPWRVGGPVIRPGETMHRIHRGCPALQPSAHLVTVGCASFNAAGAEFAAQGAILVGDRESSEIEPFRWVNTVISNLKTAISGTYHHSDFDRYRHHYLAEVQYHGNRRFDLASMIGPLARNCVRTGPCPDRWLRLAEV